METAAVFFQATAEGERKLTIRDIMSDLLALSFRTFIPPRGKKKSLLGFHSRFVPEKAFHFPSHDMTQNLNIKHRGATG